MKLDLTKGITKKEYDQLIAESNQPLCWPIEYHCNHNEDGLVSPKKSDFKDIPPWLWRANR